MRLPLPLSLPIPLASLLRLVLFVVLPLSALATAPRAEAHGKLFARAVQDLQTEQRLATLEGKQLAVLFEQEDCPACASLRRHVLPHPAAARAVRAWRTVTVRLDGGAAITSPTGDKLAPLDFAQRLQVPGTPAIAFFSSDGKLSYRHLGPLRDGQDLALLARFVREARFEELPFSVYVRQMRQKRAP